MFPLLTFWKKISLRQGLIAEYLFNNNYLDTSGRGYDGVNSGTIFVNNRKGSSNSAVSFNGTSDYILITALLAELLTNDQGTVNMWVKFNPGAGTNFAMIATEISTDLHSGLVFVRNAWKPGKLVAGFEWNTLATPLPQQSRLYADFDIDNSAWNMITWVANGDVSKFYINAILQTTIVFQGLDFGVWFNIIDEPVDTLSLGAHVRNAGNIQFFDGLMDDVRMWSRPLNQVEVNLLHTELD